MYAGRLSARAVAITRSISGMQLSGVITADTHAACAEMFAKFWKTPSPSVWWVTLRTRWCRIVGMPTRWKTHERSALAPHDPVQGRQFADRVGRHEHRTAADAGVAVGGVGGVPTRLSSRSSGPISLRATASQSRNAIIACYAEAIRNALPCKSLDDVIGDDRVCGHDDPPAKNVCLQDRYTNTRVPQISPELFAAEQAPSTPATLRGHVEQRALAGGSRLCARRSRTVRSPRPSYFNFAKLIERQVVCVFIGPPCNRRHAAPPGHACIPAHGRLG